MSSDKAQGPMPNILFWASAPTVFLPKKISNLYLVKIQICFLSRKIFRSIFSENTDLFFIFKKNVLMINCRF